MIQGTLDHIIYGDLALLSRLTGDPPQVPALGAALYDDFGAPGPRARPWRATAALGRRAARGLAV